MNEQVTSSGRIVKQGKHPPHLCMRGRPYADVMNIGTVYRCSCNKLYVALDVEIVDEYGDYYGTERQWIRCKDEDGTLYRRIDVPRDEFTERDFLLWTKCETHGWRLRPHTHIRVV